MYLLQTLRQLPIIRNYVVYTCIYIYNIAGLQSAKKNCPHHHIRVQDDISLLRVSPFTIIPFDSRESSRNWPESLSYQKKDRREWLRPSLFWYDTDFSKKKKSKKQLSYHWAWPCMPLPLLVWQRLRTLAILSIKPIFSMVDGLAVKQLHRM